MSEIFLICGKICSGKSTYARKLKDEINAVILSTDEVTFDLTDNRQGEGYDEFALRVNKYLRKKAAEIAAAGTNVILDWGFWTKSDRTEISEYFKALGISYRWYYIDISDEALNSHISARNERIAQGRGGSDFFVDAGLLSKLLSRFEVPDKNEIDVWLENND